jgi:hypothetical protein
VSKFLLNLLVQISKALVNSKIQFLFRKDIFQLLAESAQQPAGPLGLLAHPAPHASFFHLQPKQSTQAAPAEWPRDAPWPSPTTSAEGKTSPRQPYFISPLYGLPSPVQSSGNRRLQSGSIETPSTPTIEGTRPPPPRLRPIKGRPPPVKIPTPPTLLLLVHRRCAVSLPPSKPRY